MAEQNHQARSRRTTGLLAISITLICAVGAVAVWALLNQHNDRQIAGTAESASYAARSQLVRRVELLASALRNAQTYWSTYGHLPRDRRATNSAIELALFPGVEVILWDDPNRSIRYEASPDASGSLDNRPGDQEWLAYGEILSRLRAAERSGFSQPYVGDDDRVKFEFYGIRSGAADGGRLAAIIDTQETLEAFLTDESPGYVIRAFWDDLLLYERGTPARDSPDTWTQAGLIRVSEDTLWRVVHVPTAELAASFRPPAINASLLLGIVVAVLLGSLTFENGRARSRAIAAESAERRLEELNRELDQQVKLRTRDLETLTDSVGHDLRNPLNAILTNTQLLMAMDEEAARSENLPILQRMETVVYQMTGIIERLVGLSRASHSTFKRESIDMRTLVSDVIEDLMASEPPPTVTARVGDLPTVDADKVLVGVLITNLLSNAIKFTRQNDNRVIEVSAYGNDPVVFSVKDNGIGFAPQSADRLFVAYDRLDNKTVDGIGLGLAIAARVVRRHGGRIWAEGSPGEGATFYFTLASGDGAR